VLEKLGFVHEGYFRESYYEPHMGRFTDSAVFSLLRSDWRTKQLGVDTTATAIPRDHA
jgi:RimJ/RimL family protein N-acetyltransferase